MKTVFFLLLSAIGSMIYLSCTNASARYVDPTTGKGINLERDPHTGLMIDAETKKAPHMYVNTKTRDAIYGNTGHIINGHIVKQEGVYVYDEEIKIKMGDDYKMKAERSGEVKIRGTKSKKRLIRVFLSNSLFWKGF